MVTKQGASPRPVRWLLTALLLVLGVAAAPLPAHAEEETWFNSFHVDAELDRDGRIHVTTKIEYDFQDLASRGIYLTFVTRQDIEGDPDHQRVYEYSDFTAYSPTGAASNLTVEESADSVGVYIGDPDRKDVTGVHTYEVTYTVEGIPNPGVGDGGSDEIYWNIIGSGFAEPIKDFRMTLRAPAMPTDAACWHGAAGSSATCEETTNGGDRLEFHHRNLAPGEGLTIAGEYPPGSFDEAWTIIKPRANTPGLGSPGIIAIGVGLLLAAAGLIAWSWRSRRDDVYAGVPLGLEPAPGQDARVVQARPRKDFAVQFHPPRGSLPIEVGTIVAERAKSKFLGATIVDLAVRGYLLIEIGDDEDWTLHRTQRPGEDLSEHERALLAALFSDNPARVELSDLSRESRKAVREVFRTVNTTMRQRGWFTKRTGGTRGDWVAAGVVVVLASIGIGETAWMFNYFALVPPAILLGALFVFYPPRPARRTAKGTAEYAQAMGFRKFLETADARQLRFEAGRDIFSEFLPYAMVFGVVDRWVELFRSLPAEIGQNYGTAPWIGSRGATYRNLPEQISAINLTSALSTVQNSAAVAAQIVASSGSSGGSAFGGGGGSSGGGVGGGGGGRW